MFTNYYKYQFIVIRRILILYNILSFVYSELFPGNKTDIQTVNSLYQINKCLYSTQIAYFKINIAIEIEKLMRVVFSGMKN